MDTNIGKLIKNRYEVLNKISVGGTSYIYLVYDQILQRKCVLKIFFKNIFNNKKKEEYFKNEIQITAKLKHKNITKLYDYFKFDDLWCLILEYVQGETLREYLYQKKTLNETKIFEIFIQILEALIYTNKKNIVHRDIKPENIMITKNNNIKILDFGISVDKYFDFKINNNKIIGSLKYIAPEIFGNEEITIRFDIYSLGLILYEVLIGQHPFANLKPENIIQKHLYEKLFRVRKFDKSISQLMENIVVKSTAKNPSERYQNPEEMKEDFEKTLDPKYKNCRPLFLKNEIYINDFNNEFFLKKIIKEKHFFWLTKKYFFIIFLLSIFLLFSFLFFLLFFNLK